MIWQRWQITRSNLGEEKRNPNFELKMKTISPLFDQKKKNRRYMVIGIHDFIRDFIEF